MGRKGIFIGLDANRRPVYLTPEIRRDTHTHVIGGSGTGKSKFLEWLIRQDIQNRQGLCLIDWHGTLCRDVLEWCHYNDVGIFEDDRSVIVLNPSQPDYISGFNPFNASGADISTQVSRRIDATIRPWGITNTNEMPTFERTCKALFHFMVESGETLPNAAKLLDFSQRDLREYAIRCISDGHVVAIWQALQRVKTERDWREQVLSTENRLTRFLGSTAVRRFMGLTEGNLDLASAMDEGKIIIVNLGFSDFLSAEAARVFASLLLNEFFETAMRRPARTRGKPRPFSLYLDEFQEYMTDDVAMMLDQVRKGGLHLVLAHQHLGHFVDNLKLKKSVLTNARIRAVFGGLDYEDACVFGNEMFLSDLNFRQIKKAYYHTIHLFKEELRDQVSRGQANTNNWSRAQGTSSSSSDSSSESNAQGESSGGATMSALPTTEEPTEGWFTETSGSSTFSSSVSSDSDSSSSSESESTGGSESETYSVTTGTVFVPTPIQELGSEAEWSREEKLSKVAEMLKIQQQRHCFIKLDREPTQPLRVPDVYNPNVEPETLTEYESKLYHRSGSLPALEVDELLAESERDFMARATAWLSSESEPPYAKRTVGVNAQPTVVQQPIDPDDDSDFDPSN